jgi:hypothetical protein
LCNGTCATPCDMCPDNVGLCYFDVTDPGTSYCNEGGGGSCSTDCDCPRGMFCTGFFSPRLQCISTS